MLMFAARLMFRSLITSGLFIGMIKFMRYMIFFIIMLGCNLARADCLDQQRMLNRLKNDAMQNPGAMTSFGLGGCATKQISTYLKAHIVFVRQCYAELGLTRLQAEEGANEDEASLMNQGICK